MPASVQRTQIRRNMPKRKCVTARQVSRLPTSILKGHADKPNQRRRGIEASVKRRPLCRSGSKTQYRVSNCTQTQSGTDLARCSKVLGGSEVAAADAHVSEERKLAGPVDLEEGVLDTPSRVSTHYDSLLKPEEEEAEETERNTPPVFPTEVISAHDYEQQFYFSNIEAFLKIYGDAHMGDMVIISRKYPLEKYEPTGQIIEDPIGSGYLKGFRKTGKNSGFVIISKLCLTAAYARALGRTLNQYR